MIQWIIHLNLEGMIIVTLDFIVRSNLCDYSDTYILFEGTIIVPNM